MIPKLNTARTSLLIAGLLFIAAPAFAQSAATSSAEQAKPSSEQPAAEPVGRAIVQRDAAAVRAQAESSLAREFLDGAAFLPEVAKRTFFVDPATRKWMTEAEAAKLSESDRAKLKSRVCDESFYYLTRYGTPAAYMRAFDVLAKVAPDFKTWKGKHIADFGYGTIGHLRMLAASGASCMGIDVDTLLPLLYDDLSAMPPSVGHEGGAVAVAAGQWPADAEVLAKVGSGYDLFMSKNTLKNGYVNPEREVDPRMLVHLGVPNEKFVEELARIVKPGGYVLIYNICPAMAPADKPYIPWADGRCPFPREMWEAKGFEVLAFDVKDDEPMRRMGRSFGWDKKPDGSDDPSFEESFFAWYTIARRK